MIILGRVFIFLGVSLIGIFCKPLASEKNITTKLPPFIQLSFPIEFMDSAEYMEFMKGMNDPVFNSTTQAGWFTGMQYKWNSSAGTDSYPIEYDDPTTEEPIMRITVQLPPRAKIHAYMRGHAHLINDDYAYEEYYNFTHFGMTPL